MDPSRDDQVICERRRRAGKEPEMPEYRRGFSRSNRIGATGETQIAEVRLYPGAAKLL